MSASQRDEAAPAGSVSRGHLPELGGAYEPQAGRAQSPREAQGRPPRAPVAMETASTGGGPPLLEMLTANDDPDFDLLHSSADEDKESFYTSLLSGHQDAPYLSGNMKRQEPKHGLESHGGMFSSDSGIEMTPGESMDVTRNLLESEKMEAYNYMDITRAEERFEQQPQHPIKGWGDTGVTSLGQYLEKGSSVAVEDLGPALDLQSFPYVEEPSDDELSDHQPYRGRDASLFTSPIKISLTETEASSAPQHHPLSERESILSLGVEGVPTVTLSEPEDESPGSSTPPLREEESPSDLQFCAGVEKLVNAHSAPTAQARLHKSAPGEDQDGSSAESGDSEIELVSDEPAPHEQQPSPGYMTFGQVGAPITVIPPAAPSIQYSILREEREAELDSELIIESYDASSASEESPKREQDPPIHKGKTADPSLISQPTVAVTPFAPKDPSPCISNERSDINKRKASLKNEEAPPIRPQPPSTLIPTNPPAEPLVTMETAQEKAPAAVSRRGSERQAAPVYVQCFNRQKAMDLLYWRDLKQSALVFGSMLLLLFSLTQFSVVSVVAYLALAALSATISFRVYKSVLQAVQKTDEGHPFKSYLDVEISLSQEQIQKYADTMQLYLNCTMKELRRLFLVQDLVDSLKFAVLMWLLTYVGALFNGLTLLILAVVSMFTMPVVYEKYQAQIDQYLGLVRTHVNSVVGKIQEKIPGAKRKAE